jgi:segregation and condensation protein B
VTDAGFEPGVPAQPDVTEPEPATAEGAPGRPDLADPAMLRAAVEAVLFVSDAPVSPTALAAGLQRPVPEIEAALRDLARELASRGSGVELREIGEGVRLYTRPELAGPIESFLMDGQRVRLTQAALETLAVVAYRQPVTRARISAIRGVNVDGVVRTLIARGLITEVGSDPDTGGGLFRTTELFLEKMGLRSLDELPSLAPLLPDLTGLESDEVSS